ncbi:MAG: DUF3524 domain-containing protein [Candidatus Hinthialibacter antarcticus]|nr:DUF3524 domain-containing protein [Candidatus Hinthialibacter antarcticus]
MSAKQILALEPYYGGSHREWIDGLIQHSRHDIHLLTLPARKWKWRMRGAAISLAEEFNAQLAHQHWDAVLASSMLNLADFMALTRRTLPQTPAIYYLHENQITYPLHPDERIDYHFAITNLLSVLTADEVVFNSEFNKQSFFEGIQSVLSKIADVAPSAEQLEAKQAASQVIAPPVNFDELHDAPVRDGGPPVVLWNHRWDRDKKPEQFAKALKTLLKNGCEFRAILCGEQFHKTPVEFLDLKRILGSRLVHYGYAPTRRDYANLLAQSDIVVSTATQEFFGLSIVEAVYSGAFPILPRRLNYPNLVPREFHSQTLYDEDEGLPALLERTIQRAAQNQLPNLRHTVVQYGWGSLIKKYDALF